MSYFWIIFGKIAFIFLLLGVGVLVKKLRVLSDTGEQDLGRLMVDVTWPALIFASINVSLTASDIVGNYTLPFLAVGLHLIGFLAGLAVCSVGRFSGDRKNVFLFHATMNNFFIMALPFAQMMLPKKGLALLTVSNLGSTVTLWVLGVTLLSGKIESKSIVRSVLSPAMIATVSATVFVLTGVNTLIPRFALDLIATVGQPTLLLGLLAAGMQIGKLGIGAVKFDSWNILVGLVRNIVVPAAVFAFCLVFKGHLSREAVIITMLVAIAPASVNSVPLALRYRSDPDLTAEGVVFTHLLAAPSMLVFIFLIDRFLIA
jgi:predicted permease